MELSKQLPRTRSSAAKAIACFIITSFLATAARAVQHAQAVNELTLRSIALTLNTRPIQVAAPSNPLLWHLVNLPGPVFWLRSQHPEIAAELIARLPPQLIQEIAQGKMSRPLPPQILINAARNMCRRPASPVFQSLAAAMRDPDAFDGKAPRSDPTAWRRQRIIAALITSKGNVRQSAARLGTTHKPLLKEIKRFGLCADSYRHSLDPQTLLAALKTFSGKQRPAAERLGVDRKSLRILIREYGILPDDYRPLTDSMLLSLLIMFNGKKNLIAEYLGVDTAYLRRRLRDYAGYFSFQERMPKITLRRRILSALEAFSGNISLTSEHLGISCSRLYRYLARSGILAEAYNSLDRKTFLAALMTFSGNQLRVAQRLHLNRCTIKERLRKYGLVAADYRKPGLRLMTAAIIVFEGSVAPAARHLGISGFFLCKSLLKAGIVPESYRPPRIDEDSIIAAARDSRGRIRTWKAAARRLGISVCTLRHKRRELNLMPPGETIHN